MALRLLLTDRGCDRLQSRIRTGDSTTESSFLQRSYLEESLECCWVQCSQRHQRSDGNVLVIHQMTPLPSPREYHSRIFPSK
jgi:hypothetical protein